jgi:transcriptional regulator with XRE-family HTH domain
VPRDRDRLYAIDHAEARRRREQAGLTQVELATKAKVSPVTICKMEQPGGTVTMRTLRRVAAALDAAESSPSLRALLGRSG